ncbi:hypothetical protein ERJ75_000712100 [Trypanosoma vivax]|nr:hypothetical protein ERJ75_000712100 [Trypanosoma vivax]
MPINSRLGRGELPFDTLSDLCTTLAIMEGASDAPRSSVKQLVGIVNTTIQKGCKSGDVVVMATRALVLLLDKFPKFFSSTRVGSALETSILCFKAVFGIVKKNDKTPLRHEQTTSAELKEELLNCLSLAANYKPLRGVIPSVEEQLHFCVSAVDGSKWTSCKVLQHCIRLMRCGRLKNASTHQLLENLLSRHLLCLQSIDIDHEWDELLRTVVEGVLTYSTWCAPHIQQKQARKKRTRSFSEVEDDVSLGVSRLAAMSEPLLNIGERISTSGTADIRIQLTLACLASVVDTSSIREDKRVGALCWLANLLEMYAMRGTSFSTPFGNSRGSSSSELVSTDVPQVLPNLQWVVPPLLWSALVLIAKLCSKDFSFSCEYLWAWRGNGDEYFSYSRKVRQRLTAMYFAASKPNGLARPRHVIDLQAMTDTSSITGKISKIHFQPIPIAMKFNETLIMPSKKRQLPGSVIKQLQEALQPFSFGNTQIASLARCIRFHVICIGAPASTEDVVSAFCSALTVPNKPSAEEISATLLRRNKGWAAVLLEAGLGHCSTPDSLFESGRLGKRARKCALVSDAHEVGRGTSHASPQKLFPQGLPPPQLVDYLRRASSSEVLMFFTELESSAYTADEVTVLCNLLTADNSLTTQIQSAAYTYILRTLYQTSNSRTEGKALTDRAHAESYLVSFCDPLTVDGSKCSPQCPSGHPLHVHFSINWICDVCKSKSLFGSLACRICNYDLCPSCTNTTLSRFDVNFTATVGDVIRAWSKVGARGERNQHLLGQNSTAGGANEVGMFVFTSDGIVPASAPAWLISDKRVHIAPINGHCRCGEFPPLSVAGFFRPTALDSSPLCNFLHVFLSMKPRSVGPTVELSIVSALESCGAEIFSNGVSGISPRLVLVLYALAPFVSLALKRDMAHFIAVGCRRFGLYHLQNADVTARGDVVGDIESNGLASRVAMERDTNSITENLYKTFLGYPSLRNKLEFNFVGEEGVGEGPTQELYTELSQRYRSMDELWHRNDDGVCVAFPTLERVCQKEFFVLGASCARAFVDGHTMSIDFMPAAWTVVRSKSVSTELLCGLLAAVEPALMKSYSQLTLATDDELRRWALKMTKVMQYLRPRRRRYTSRSA